MSPNFPHKLKILHLEDLPSDAELVERALKKGLFDFEKIVVDNKSSFEKALDEFSPDVIVSDHSLPSFNSIEAIRIVKAKGMHLPFILVTSTMTDEFAVTVMKEGINDYILKDRLERLPSAVLNSLEKFRLEKEKELFTKRIFENEKKFRTLIEKNNDMITLSTKDGKMLYGSPSITTRFGYSIEEIPGASFTDFLHPDDLVQYLDKRQEVINKPGKSYYSLLRLRHKNGNWIWCEATITNMLEEPGIEAMVSNFRDVSEKKLLEEQREFDRDNLNALINNTNDIMWSVDRNFNIITFNQRLAESVERISGKLIRQGSNIFTLGFPEEQALRFKKNIERAFGGESFTEIEHTEKPVEIWSEISFYPIHHGKEIVGTACHSHNITERKKAELEREKIISELIQRSKSLEQFAYIVSHNLRSPVANILGISNLLKGNISDADRTSSQGFLFGATEQLDETIKDLNKILQIKSDITEPKEPIHFSKLIADIEISIKDLIKNGTVKIETDFSEIDSINSIKSYIHSIFYNLISNSIKYRIPNEPAVIEIKTLKDQYKISIVFRDHGMGIDLKKHGEKIFGLYKRFHANAEGKGMGLFMVKTQIEAMGGCISVKSQPDKGIEFEIELPT